jgi:hypothetical protein
MASDDGILTRFFWQPHEEQTYIARSQDCDPYLEEARRRALAPQDPEMRLAAIFPLVVVERYCQERGITFAEWMQNEDHRLAMMADPALSGFRVWRGRP